METNWNEIRQEHGPLVWSVAWRILKHHADALDCSQEVFTEAIRRSESSPIENWAAFLRWLTTRRALDLARRRQRTRSVSSLSELPHEQPVDQMLEYEELTEQVRSALTRVPEKQATAFWLVCVEELSYREVAEHMQVNTSEVGVLVHRARKHLKQALPVLQQSNKK